MSNLLPWKCSECQFLLGYVENKKIIRIKRKDLYIEAEGGRILVNCCRCGKRNELIDEKNTDEVVPLTE